MPVTSGWPASRPRSVSAISSRGAAGVGLDPPRVRACRRPRTGPSTVLVLPTSMVSSISRAPSGPSPMSRTRGRVGERADREVVDAGLGDGAARSPGSARRWPRAGPGRPRRATASRSSAGGMLSSRTRSAPAASTAVELVERVDLDLDRQPGPARRVRRRRPRATPPAATTWLSLTSAASDSDIRWLTPPPQRTAYFSSARSPGSGLAGVADRRRRCRRPRRPSAGSGWRCRTGGTSRFSAVRSAVSRSRVGPVDGQQHVARRDPVAVGARRLAARRPAPSPTTSKTASATGSPATTPAAAGDEVGRRRAGRPAPWPAT